MSTTNDVSKHWFWVAVLVWPAGLIAGIYYLAKSKVGPGLAIVAISALAGAATIFLAVTLTNSIDASANAMPMASMEQYIGDETTKKMSADYPGVTASVNCLKENATHARCIVEGNYELTSEDDPTILVGAVKQVPFSYVVKVTFDPDTGAYIWE